MDGMRFPHLSELESLCNALADGECDADDFRRIEKLVLSNDAAARFYVRFFNVHNEISDARVDDEYQDRLQSILEKLNSGDLPKAELPSPISPKLEGFLGGDLYDSQSASIFSLLDLESELLSETGESILPCSEPESKQFFNFTKLTNYIPLIISLVSLGLVLSAVVIMPFYWARFSSGDAWQVVARIKQANDCCWSDQKEALPDGAFLISGQELGLKVGLVDIEFASGAQVVLQGPAQFVLEGKNSLKLLRGRLAACVSKGAEGFAVYTPGLEVVDLGTEFGVAVGQGKDSDTEVHVFKGLVQVETASLVGTQTSLKLKKNEAIICDARTHKITSIPVAPRSFARSVDSTVGITHNLQLINPSFEQPDIRYVPQFQSGHGDTGLIEIQGWKYSGIHPNGLTVDVDDISPNSPYVTYQIAPHESSNPELSVSIKAAEGRQVILVELQSGLNPETKVSKAWIYQSIGTVEAVDVGRQLSLEVDAGLRAKIRSDTITMMAGFATNVAEGKSGVYVGNTDLVNGASIANGFKTMRATLPLTNDLVGQELFVVLTAMDKENTQCFFDNARVSIIPTNPKGDEKNVMQ